MLNVVRLMIVLVSFLSLFSCASLEPARGLVDANNIVLKEPGEVVPLSAEATLISPALLIEELDIIKTHLSNVHPQPFARIQQSEFDEKFELLKQTLNYPLSPTEYYLRVAPLLASLKDVHTYVHLPKVRTTTDSVSSENLLPLAIIVQKNEVYVAADLSEKPTVPTGASIISINKAPINFLLNVMRTLVTKETLSGQSKNIQMSFSRMLSAMGYAGEQYIIEYQWHGVNYTVELEGLTVQTADTEKDKPMAYYGFTQLTRNTALLWLNDFNENPDVFKHFLDEKFDLMAGQGVDNLIIDIRYNSGGLSENLKNLLNKIANKSLPWAKKGTIKISEKLKKNHRRKTRKRRQNKFHWGLQWLPVEWTDKLQHSIWWSEPGDFIELELSNIPASDSYIPSKVWVLTNGYCYSACSLFVANVNHHQLGKTIGEKTGSIAQVQFAYPVQFKLPHSALTMTIPTMQLDFVESELKDLISPQKQITRDTEDIQNRNDPVLNSALREAEYGQY